MEVVNDVLGYQNLKIYQNTDMFQFSLDSVLLANFVTINPKVYNILDIGTGNAIIPIILSKKTSAKITGVEIQKESFKLAIKSVKINQLEDQIQLIQNDIKEYSQKLSTETFDVITCNPPFFKINENSNVNESIYKRIARHEIYLNLEDIITISKKILKNNGRLAIVHRPERLIEIIILMKKHHIEPKKMCFIYPKIGKEANILLIEGVKNGKSGLKILPPIYTYDTNGNYTEEIQKFFS